MKAVEVMAEGDRQMQHPGRARRSLIPKLAALLVGVFLPIILGAVELDLSGDCSPHHEATIGAPDGRHVAERWVSICGFPGSTVTDLISVTERPITRPPWNGVFAFNEDPNGGNDQVSAIWIDDRHLRITINAIGDVQDSPNRIGNTMVDYDLGPGADLDFARSQIDTRVEERRQWERLKNSSSWHYVEIYYSADAYMIDHFQNFIDWAKHNAMPRP